MFQVYDVHNKKYKLGGKSAGVVVDNRDPLKRGRIRVDHPILGITNWMRYLRTPSSFSVPSIGDVVYVECDAGYETHPIAWGNIVTGEDNNPNLPESFKRDVPTNRGFFTPGGHLVEFDDGLANLTQDPLAPDQTTENKGIRFTSSGGNKIHINEDSDNGVETILIEDSSGNLIKLDYGNGQLVIESKGTTDFKSTGDRTDTVEANLTVTVNGDATISSQGTAIYKGTGGTEVGDGSSITEVKGSVVNIAGGGPGVARLGDRALGVGNLGGPVTSTIIFGSTKVTSG